MALQQKFSKALLGARVRLGLTPEQVAEAVSIPTGVYQQIESGQRLPDTIELMRLLLFLGIDVEQFTKELGITRPDRLK